MPDLERPRAGDDLPVVLEAIAEIDGLADLLRPRVAALEERLRFGGIDEAGRRIGDDEVERDLGASRRADDDVAEAEFEAEAVPGIAVVGFGQRGGDGAAIVPVGAFGSAVSSPVATV